MTVEKPRFMISDQFKKSALALNMSCLLKMAEASDEAEINLGKLEGLVVGARAELKTRKAAYERMKEITSPQSEFFLSVMQEEADVNIARSHATTEATAS